MQIHYFDIVVGVIIVLLGLKGIINGFFKELFGLIGIIGGIFVASRIGGGVGEYLSDLIFHFDNESAAHLTGFLVTLALFWGVMVLLGTLFKKLSSASGLGPVDRLFGFILGSGKFFLIAAVIFFAINNIKAIHKNLAPLMEKSLLFPLFIEVGDVIMHIDPTEISGNIDKSIKEGSEAISKKSKELLQDEAKELIEETKEKIEKAQRR